VFHLFMHNHWKRECSKKECFPSNPFLSKKTLSLTRLLPSIVFSEQSRWIIKLNFYGLLLSFVFCILCISINHALRVHAFLVNHLYLPLGGAARVKSWSKSCPQLNKRMETSVSGWSKSWCTVRVTSLGEGSGLPFITDTLGASIPVYNNSISNNNE